MSPDETMILKIIGTILVVDSVVLFFFLVQCYFISPFSYKYVEKWTRPDIGIAPPTLFPLPHRGIVPVSLAMTMVWSIKALRKKLGSRYEEYRNSFPRLWFYYLSILGYLQVLALLTFLITIFIGLLV